MPAVLHECRGLAQPAVCRYRKRRHAATGVVGNQDILTCLVHSNVARVSSAGWHFIQKRELAAGGINREGAHASTVLALVLVHFIHCIEEALIRVYGEE